MIFISTIWIEKGKINPFNICIFNINIYQLINSYNPASDASVKALPNISCTNG